MIKIFQATLPENKKSPCLKADGINVFNWVGFNRKSPEVCGPI